ncbi:MAG: hypothetical protein C4575_12465 [Desulforudis sp.]|nr:MAG: hypothetical protein C4575_12465 [Desulforudis sp.]
MDSPIRKIIIATGDRDLDNALRDLCDGDGQSQVVASGVGTTEDLLALTRRHLPNVVVVSSLITGHGARNLESTLRAVLELSARVVFLAAHLPESDDMVKAVVSMGISSILFNPLVIDDILDHIRRAHTAEDSKASLTPWSGETEREPPDHKTDTVCQVRGAAISGSSEEFDRVDPAEGPDQNTNNLVLVWSPVSAGKSFIAINLAVYLGQFESTVLIGHDGDEGTLCRWLQLPAGGIPFRVIVGDTSSPQGFKTPLALGLSVFLDETTVDISALMESFASIVVVDGRDVIDVSMLDRAGTIIIVTDPDPAHVNRLRLVVGELEPSILARCVLVINKQTPDIDTQHIEDSIGLKASCELPYLNQLLPGQYEGIPCVLYCPEVREVIAKLATRLVGNGSINSGKEDNQ